MTNEGDTAAAFRLPGLTLVLGGARSGKSHHAETLVMDHVRATGTRPVYIATTEAGDAEMLARIAEHQARRDAVWTTVETLLGLGDALDRHATGDRPVLVDSLTLWLSNVMHAGLDVAAEFERLRRALDETKAPVVCVSDEVGLGIVPDSAIGRVFRDELGRLNQRIAAQADQVVFVAAGLPLVLKDEQ
jgi:adenosylcobinamide kinase/adenosylcobinamide-phosphate guanylyltransferase